jgi:NTE family protein
MASACTYPVRNQQATLLATDTGYRWTNLKRAHPSDTLLIVTASGGGTRAAALELSVLKAMQQIRLETGDTLSDEIDILSSVSGGSVTAAYFALRGSDGFADLETNFIRKDGISALLTSGLNPVGLARLSTPAVERIDLLIDYLSKTLFTHHETYADLLAKGRRPYLILNAADMVDGIPFAFTQNNFDLLCSDLLQMPLATAVAASAAFPVALSPVTLKNYSRCPAQDALPDWPPAWAVADADTDWHTSPERTDRGRAELAYAAGRKAPTPKDYIHLLDGGIADNLGIAEPYRILTTNGAPPQFMSAFAQGDIKNIVFIMINARSFAASTLDQEHATPGIVDMLLGSIDSSIDRTTAGSAQRLRDGLGERFEADAADLEASQPEMAANLRKMPDHTKLLEIDFDAINDSTCRRRFQSIGTSWTNTNAEINSLLDVGGALLASDPSFPAVLRLVHGGVQGTLPDIKTACDALDPAGRQAAR